jgi:S-phase kinase-associated protein 1
MSLKLKSEDGWVYTIDADAAKLSSVFDCMLEFYPDDDDPDPVLLRGYSGEILEKVIEWITHHKNDSNKDDNYAKVSEWDQRFFKRMNEETLSHVIIAANYLNIGGLIKLSSKAMVSRINLIASRYKYASCSIEVKF